MKKRIVVIALVVALVATCFAGTFAYLTDKDAAVNVMTLGKVDIVQNEQQRGENGELVDFVQDKPAYPAVGEIDWAPDEEALPMPGGKMLVFDEGLENVVDKFVSVSNIGKSNAYVRTIIAIEDPVDANDRVHVNINDEVGVDVSDWSTIVVDGVTYSYKVFTYTDALAPGYTTPYSLAQVFLDSEATNEDCAKFGEAWEIVALSQAVQADGFADAQTALDTAFGAVTDAATAEWVKAVIEG